MRRSLVLVSRLAALSAVAALVGCGTGAPAPAGTAGANASGGSVGPGGLATPERLQRHLETMDGYVGVWVSDGVDLFNVVVTGDPEAAHTALSSGRESCASCVVRRAPRRADR